jgi:hypothetical protein
MTRKKPIEVTVKMPALGLSRSELNKLEKTFKNELVSSLRGHDIVRRKVASNLKVQRKVASNLKVKTIVARQHKWQYKSADLHPQ